MNEERAPRPPARSRRHFAVVYVLPVLAALAWIALPLVRGTETLYMRDVLNAHLAMKVSEARALRQGYFPLIDPYRGGGQPLAGNPNAVPFYPTNLLFLWASPIWALNAHFWLHLLLAPFAFYWMARRWGVARERAWAAAVCYVGSGFFLSHLSFYNLIAGATLAPALVAACLGFADHRGPRRRLYAVAVAALWALLLVSGDPLMAALAAGLAAVALLVAWPRWGWRDVAEPAVQAELEERTQEPAERPERSAHRPAWGALALLAMAFALGVVVALPQIVEFLRILPVSFRGFRGYTADVATIDSWDPRQVVEWLLPTIFGRLDVLGGGSFWGRRYYTGAPPFYPSLYPGLLALALVAASGWPRRRGASLWAWSVAGLGVFCSLGRFNPLTDWLFAHMSGGSLRYPVKFWLPVAVGAALLCGLGFAQLLAALPPAAAWRRFRGVLGAEAMALGALLIFLNALPGPALKMLRFLIPSDLTQAFVTNERLRWSGLCLFSLVVVAALAVISGRMARSPRAALIGGGLLLAAHGFAQTALLRPLYPTDAVAPYRVPPPALAYLPRDLTVVDPDFEHLFGQSTLSKGKFPSLSLLWLERRAFYELFPFTGSQWGRRYEVYESPEGLDTYLTRMVQGGLKGATDAERMRQLAAFGVGRLLIERPLAPSTPHARLLAQVPSFGETLHIYEVTGGAPAVYLARGVRPADNMTVAYRLLKQADFNPAEDVVIQGKGPAWRSDGGSVEVTREGPESLDLDLDVGASGSVLVVQRALLLYRATLDGRPTQPFAANIHRNGLSVPAGHHRVKMWIDRTNFHRSVTAACLGMAILLLLAFSSVLDRWRQGTRGSRQRLVR